MMPNEELAIIQKQRARLFDILNRHVRAGDDIFNDRSFIMKVFRRWSDESNSHIGDPADGVILDKEASK